MIAEIDRAREAGDTMGGGFEVVAHDVPPGLGSYVQWDRKLDGRLAQALMSIPAIKAVGIGRGPAVASLPGSRIHDEILPMTAARRPTATGVVRPTNNAGGLEGGVTNGEDLRVSGYMKPIATLMKPLRSVDLTTMADSPAAIERSDVCAVPAAAVVGEAMVAIVLADAAIEKFGGDSLEEISHGARSAIARPRDLPADDCRARAANAESADCKDHHACRRLLVRDGPAHLQRISGSMRLCDSADAVLSPAFCADRQVVVAGTHS